jgi:hypothetical protein
MHFFKAILITIGYVACISAAAIGMPAGGTPGGSPGGTPGGTPGANGRSNSGQVESDSSKWGLDVRRLTAVAADSLLIRGE